MSRYFSKLAKRTGIAANSAGKMRRQTAGVYTPPAFQPNKRASLTGDLEANVEKIVDSTVPQRNSVTESSISKDSKPGLQSPAEKDVLTSVSNASLEKFEFSVREHHPSQSIKAISVKKDNDDDSAEVRPTIPEMTVHAHVPQPGILNEEDQQSRNMPESGNQPHETSSETTAVKNDEPDNVLLIEKRQYIASPENRAPRQNHFAKSELTPGSKNSISEDQPKGEEKTIETKTTPLESEWREARESGDDSFFDPMPYTGITETPSTSPATIESSEKTTPMRGPRTIHIISESERPAETKLEKAESPAPDNSVDIHIGTITFEVHQAPEKKTVPDHPPPVPRPVAIQQTPSPKTPRLSRYYLRGM